jgi:hypothetical protein
MKIIYFKNEEWLWKIREFVVDVVVVVGHSTDFYKVYCLNSKTNKALYFDLKYAGDQVSVIDADKIFYGNLTQTVTVSQAIRLLQDCPYDTPVKPIKEKFDNLLALLNANI